MFGAAWPDRDASAPQRADAAVRRMVKNMAPFSARRELARVDDCDCSPVRHTHTFLAPSNDDVAGSLPASDPVAPTWCVDCAHLAFTGHAHCLRCAATTWQFTTLEEFPILFGEQCTAGLGDGHCQCHWCCRRVVELERAHAEPYWRARLQ